MAVEGGKVIVGWFLKIMMIILLLKNISNLFKGGWSAAQASSLMDFPP